MKKEFEALQSVLFNSNTYDINGNDNWNEVNQLLIALRNKIDEAEKRMTVAKLCSNEIINAIAIYQDAIDNGSPFTMAVRHYDTIRSSSDDVRIALDLNDDMPIKDNWHNMFVEIKKEVFLTLESSEGSISCDEDGNVLEVDAEEDSYLFKITKFDIAEYLEFLNSKGIEFYHRADILSVNFWEKNNGYNMADEVWRKRIYEGEDVMVAVEKETYFHHLAYVEDGSLHFAIRSNKPFPGADFEGVDPQDEDAPNYHLYKEIPFGQCGFFEGTTFVAAPTDKGWVILENGEIIETVETYIC